MMKQVHVLILKVQVYLIMHTGTTTQESYVIFVITEYTMIHQVGPLLIIVNACGHSR